MNGDTIFISIESLDKLALRDLQDFLRCLKYLGLDDETLKQLSDRHFQRIKNAQTK
jgi:hypothetical protein